MSEEKRRFKAVIGDKTYTDYRTRVRTTFYNGHEVAE